MKLIIIIFILSFIAASSFAQRVPSSCDAPDSIKRMYREDAAWLALQYEQKINSPYLDSVIISRDLQNRFMNALIAVYNVVGLPEADTVTRIPLPHDGVTPHALSPQHPFSLVMILLKLDTSISWERRFYKQLKPTYNNSFDSLIEKYRVVFDTVYKGYSPYWRAITHLPYNSFVLDSLISKTANFYYFARPGFVSGYGDGIDGIIKDSIINLSYSLGWIDCGLGCLYHRYWKFTIFADCSVQFDTSYTISPESNVVDFNSQINSYLIFYPNPASGTLTIETQPQTTIEIIDILGNTLRKIITTEGKTWIDISALLKGTYYVRSSSKSSKVFTAKFIKE